MFFVPAQSLTSSSVFFSLLLPPTLLRSSPVSLFRFSDSVFFFFWFYSIHFSSLFFTRRSSSRDSLTLPFLLTKQPPCPLHSAGSSHTTYVPRASELVATAERSLDYAPSLFYHHPPPPFSRAHTHSLTRGPHRHPLVLFTIAEVPTTVSSLCSPTSRRLFRSSLSRRRFPARPPPPPRRRRQLLPLFCVSLSLSRLSNYHHALSPFVALTWFAPFTKRVYVSSPSRQRPGHRFSSSRLHQVSPAYFPENLLVPLAPTIFIPPTNVIASLSSPTARR